MRKRHSKAGAGSTIIMIVGVLLTGFLLFHFTSEINDYRIDALSNAEDTNIIEKILLFALMPLLWGGYLFFSYLALINATGLPGL